MPIKPTEKHTNSDNGSTSDDHSRISLTSEQREQDKAAPPTQSISNERQSAKDELQSLAESDLQQSQPNMIKAKIDNSKEVETENERKHDRDLQSECNSKRDLDSMHSDMRTVSLISQEISASDRDPSERIQFVANQSQTTTAKSTDTNTHQTKAIVSVLSYAQIAENIWNQMLQLNRRYANMDNVLQWIQCSQCKKWRTTLVPVNSLKTWTAPRYWQCSQNNTECNKCDLKETKPNPRTHSKLQLCALDIHRKLMEIKGSCSEEQHNQMIASLQRLLQTWAVKMHGRQNADARVKIKIEPVSDCDHETESTLTAQVQPPSSSSQQHVADIDEIDLRTAAKNLENVTCVWHNKYDGYVDFEKKAERRNKKSTVIEDLDQPERFDVMGEEEEFHYDGMDADDSEGSDASAVRESVQLSTLLNQGLRQNEVQPLQSEQVPGLTITLFDHQKKGVAWMLQMEKDKKHKGGFLCDEMGVGKTIQIIALMLASRHRAREKKRAKYEHNGEQFSSDDDDDDYEDTDSEYDEATNLDGFIVDDDGSDCRSDPDGEYNPSLDMDVDEDADVDDDQDLDGYDDDSVKLEISRHSNSKPKSNVAENETSDNKAAVDDKDAASTKHKNSESNAEYVRKYMDKERRHIALKNRSMYRKKRKSAVFNSCGPPVKRRKLDSDHTNNQEVKQHDVKQRTLIVAPVAIIDQWEQEIQDKTEDAQFTVAVYHGPKRKLKFDRHVFRGCDVVITTYGHVWSEYAKGNNYKQSGLFKLPQRFFHRVVLDEAHLIKNGLSQQAKACYIIANRGVKVRWCLTGTPIQNRLLDLFPLCRFLQLRGCGSKHDFKKTLCLTNDAANSKMKVTAFLAAHMLRRLKADVVDNLVSKTEEVVELQFNDAEESIYQSFEKDAQFTFNEYVRAGVAKKNYTCILGLFLRLQQISDHPYLALKSKPAEGEEEITKKESERPYSDNSRQMGDPSGQIDNQNIDGEIMVEKMTMRNSNYPQKKKKGQRKIVWRKVMRAKGAYRSKEQMEEEEEKAMLMEENETKEEKLEKLQKKFEWDTYKVDEKWESEFKDDTEEGYSDRDKYSNPENGSKFVPSSKTKMMLQKIQWIRKHKPKDKIIVFSQFLTMLSVLERVLRKHRLDYMMYHGGLTRICRRGMIKRFEKDKERNEIPIMLMSLKCAALGLNLTVANHVIFADLWWNPAVEQQAIDRVHRIGQKKHVYVTRMIVKGSVEERILNLQRVKQKAADWALGGANFAKQNRLSIADLARLFGSDHDETIIDPAEKH